MIWNEFILFYIMILNINKFHFFDRHWSATNSHRITHSSVILKRRIYRGKSKTLKMNVKNCQQRHGNIYSKVHLFLLWFFQLYVQSTLIIGHWLYLSPNQFLAVWIPVAVFYLVFLKTFLRSFSINNNITLFIILQLNRFQYRPCTAGHFT